MFGGFALTFARGKARHALRSIAQDQGLAIVDRPHLLLVAEPEVPILEGGQAVLVGQLFSRDDRPVDALPSALGDGPDSHEASEFLESHWGNFALFVASEDRPSAYREPSANVPVYRIGEGADCMFVSNAVFATRLDLIRTPEIDLGFAVHWLQFPFLRTRRTGLSGVTELLPGTLVRATRAGNWAEVLKWNPREFASSSRSIIDPGEAIRLVRERALSAVPLQSRKGALLELSGGLDSSIIAACLAQAGSDISCVNFATRSAEGDEREYARSVAAACGLILAELGEAGSAALKTDASPRFHPATNPLLAPLELAVEALIKRTGASLLIDGAGGDNLFCSLATTAPVIDALLKCGPRQAGNTARDIAGRADSTLWHVLHLAGRRLFRRRAMWKEDRSFLCRQVLLKGPEPHPWLRGGAQLLPGKREHVEALVHIHHFLDRGCGNPLKVHPLLAQPLLEACLRIPTWMWMDGGRDRAVARDAFAGLLPAPVLARRSKGSLQGMFHRSFGRLRPPLRELLMSGELKSRGIVDGERIDDALSGEDCSDEVQLRLTELAALELWIQSWTAQRSGRPTPP